MGSGNSLPCRIERNEQLDYRLDMSLRMIDRCVVLALDNVPIAEGITALNDNRTAMDQFLKFLEGTHPFLLEGDFSFSPSPDVKIRDLGQKFNSYFGTTHDRTLHLEKTLNPLLIESLQSAFSKFLRSKYYSEWRLHEVNEAIDFIYNYPQVKEITLPELETPSQKREMCSRAVAVVEPLCETILTLLNDEGRNEIELTPAVSFISVASSEKSCIRQTLLTCDQLELSTLFTLDVWLTVFIASMETLPFGITLSVLSSNKGGERLIYVNKYFEMMSGYDRHHLIGEQVGYLQNNETVTISNQQNTLKRFTASLTHGESVVTSLVCARATGEQFLNVIGVRPVSDAWFTVRYVISIQKGIKSRDDTDLHQLQDTIQGLVDSLPFKINTTI